LRYQASEQQCVALPWYEEKRGQEKTEDKKRQEGEKIATVGYCKAKQMQMQ
jgi:hypothetical protein